MSLNQLVGKRGENLAQNYLKKKGYNIIETNFRCDFGEADIIATKDKEIVFAEVKTRTQEVYGTAADGITFQKKKHIYKVAEYYILKNKLFNFPISLDVIEIYLYINMPERIIHIKNAIIEKPMLK